MTNTEQKRIDTFRFIGCICCALNGNLNPNYDVHHIVDSGYRRLSGGHLSTIPLCPWHHRGVATVRADLVEVVAGPSMALNKRAFTLRFGTERELLAKVNDLITLRTLRIA